MTWWERRIHTLLCTPTMSLMFEQASTYIRLLRVIDCKNHCLTWCTFQTSKWDRPVCHAGLVNICSWLSQVCVNLGKSFTFCDENVMSKMTLNLTILPVFKTIGDIWFCNMYNFEMLMKFLCLFISIKCILIKKYFLNWIECII